LSEHRFREAIREAARAREQRPADDWNYGVLGDGHLELGEYDQAFAAFQRMMDLRPTAGAYARAAYAFELRGQLERALDAMRLSTDATAPNDPESLAWHHAQMGDLHRQLGHLDAAELEYRWAERTFPDHPFASAGIARLQAARGDRQGAAAAYERAMSRSPSPDVAERLGDLYMALGRSREASQQYALAEAGWRFDAPQPASLARFLADHDRSIGEAVQLAERAAADRQDIFTEDALAWCYFKAGRLADAEAAMKQARRTGTKDRSILAHAAAIAARAAEAVLPLNRLQPIQYDRDRRLRRIANGSRDQKSASVGGCGVAGAVVLPIGDVRSEQLARPAGLDDIRGCQRDRHQATIRREIEELVAIPAPRGFGPAADRD
jgi:tetratricopeptide (TPR) repeat protein